MKNTRFKQLHEQAGAKMVEFAGYYMPIQYPNGIIHEHKLVREAVGVFDVSHMGEFEIKGKDALSFVQKISVNDASQLGEGGIQYSAMLYKDGGIVDDMLTYKLADNHYMLVVNASNIEKDWNWCVENSKDFDIELINSSDDFSLLAVQGPNARKVVEQLTDVDISEEGMPFYTHKSGKVAGTDMIISRTGYTGELGFELYFRGSEATAESVWKAIFEAGKDLGIEPVGLGCRDTLRLEKGFVLYGNDIDQTTNPIEAGLGWITKLDIGDFNGKAVCVKTKEENPTRRLVGFSIEGQKLIPRKGFKVFDGDKEIGEVTSGSLSPMLNKPIGMAYVGWDYRKSGTEIEIEARGKRFPAKVERPPFVK